jgi:hypothetical protein
LCALSTIESCASAEVATSSSENVSASIEGEIASRPSSVSPGRASVARYSPPWTMSAARSMP